MCGKGNRRREGPRDSFANEGRLFTGASVVYLSEPFRRGLHVRGFCKPESPSQIAIARPIHFQIHLSESTRTTGTSGRKHKRDPRKHR